MPYSFAWAGAAVQVRIDAPSSASYYANVLSPVGSPSLMDEEKGPYVMLTFRFVEEELSETRDYSAEIPLAEEGEGESMPTGQGETSSPEYRSHRLQEMSWNDIDKPGCYVLVDSGDLLRIPQEALAAGHSPLICVTSVEETRVAKLTDNPADPISSLRNIAADNDYFVHF